MGVELAAVEAMLDDIHESLPSSRDKNSYTLGRIGDHNIVIAVMPEIGNNQSQLVATQLLNDFRSIRFGLLVGIGGGVPDEEGENDIRLGDVVVSKPTGPFSGVVQYDMGKVQAGSRFERTGNLGKPPSVLSSNVQRLQAQHLRRGSEIMNYLTEMLQKYPAMADEGYTHQGLEYDRLFKMDYLHAGGTTCQKCDLNQIVQRVNRRNTHPRIHCGTIGSGNVVIKDGTTREQLRKELGVLCVEMEAAGLMDEFSCVVIRGICDYADSHKNKRWQPYAAATAAAYMKELLYLIPTHEVQNTPAAGEALQKSSE